jgi:hypothetical protein
MKIKPNDSAFPKQFEDGLTKREYFTAIAMQGLLTRQMPDVSTDLGILESDRIASESVIMADKIIKELSK